MNRLPKFALSRKPYAVDLSSLRVGEVSPRWDGAPLARAEIDAVWFRRRRGVTVACIGRLWDYQSPPPVDAAQFLAQATDGRYGGDCDGRWDGVGYWGSELPDVRDRHMAILVPMLVAYPAIPDGYDGWWTYHEESMTPC